MKRILAIVLTLVTVGALCFTLVGCAGTKTDDKGLNYKLDKATNTYTVTGYTGTAAEVEIPSKYETLLVTSIADGAFKGNKTITKVTVPEGVKSIGANAFYGCTELNEIVFAEDSVMSEISTGAFSGCTKLDNVKLPDGVTKIGYKAFNNCTAMKQIVFPKNLEVIDYYAFSGCQNLIDVDFDNTKSFRICANAFSGCPALTDLMTPHTENAKAEYTYSNGMLTEKVEGGVKLIKWLKEGDTCEITADVIEIHPQAFTARDDIAKFVVADGNKNYMSENGIIYNKDKTKLIAFPNAAELETVTVEYGVKEIDAYAFCGNILAKEIILPETVEKIGEYAFSNSYIEKLTTAGNKIKLGANAFNGCTEFGSFKYIAKNTEYYIENGVLFREYKNSSDKTVIELVCYPADTAATSYEIPATVTAINSGAFSLSETLETITVAEGNTTFLAEDGILYEASEGIKAKLYAVPSANRVTDYVLPETVKGIAAYAFYGNKNIVTVTLNEACEQIPSHMFNGCESLKTLNIPANEIDFGENSVSGTALESVTFGGNKIAWTKAVNNATIDDKEILELIEPVYTDEQ